MQNIRAGIATKLGVVISVLTLAKPVIDQGGALIENTQAHWGTADKTSLISGAAIAGVVLLGRFAQAVAAVVTGKAGGVK
jgi:hypothetical protein